MFYGMFANRVDLFVRHGGAWQALFSKEILALDWHSLEKEFLQMRKFVVAAIVAAAGFTAIPAMAEPAPEPTETPAPAPTEDPAPAPAE